MWLSKAPLTAADNGILPAATAFGQTMVAARVTAARKVNTLVIVELSAGGVGLHGPAHDGDRQTRLPGADGRSVVGGPGAGAGGTRRDDGLDHDERRVLKGCPNLRLRGRGGADALFPCTGGGSGDIRAWDTGCRRPDDSLT